MNKRIIATTLLAFTMIVAIGLTGLALKDEIATPAKQTAATDNSQQSNGQVLGCSLGSIAGSVAYPVDNFSSAYTQYTSHVGVDFGVNTGSNVYAVADGIVIYTRNVSSSFCSGLVCGAALNDAAHSFWTEETGWLFGGYGSFVAIKHADGVTVYAHLLSDSITVKTGDCVTMNTLIGKSDSSGNSSGPHLHFEMRKEKSSSCTFVYYGVPDCYYNMGSNASMLSTTLSANRNTNMSAVNTGQYQDNATSLTQPSAEDLANSTTQKKQSTTYTESDSTGANSVTTLETKLTLDNPDNFQNSTSSYYYNLPNNYNMESCEKVVTNNGGEDVISGNVQVGPCVAGMSKYNNQLPCNYDWVLGYADVVSVENFPLLNFLAAIEPTKDNQISPKCALDIFYNSTNTLNGKVALNFSNNYAGLLRFSSGSGMIDISYPRLGTAIACSTVDFRDTEYSLYLDIQSYNTKLPIVSGSDTKSGSTNTSDSFITQLVDSIKNSNIFSSSLLSKENEQIKTVEEIQKSAGVKSPKEKACSDLTGNAITRVNISDAIQSDESNDTFVVNQGQEITQLTHTQLCDLQYISLNVSGASCTMTSNEVFNKPAGTKLVGSYPGATMTYVNNEPYCANVICGATFGCDATYADAYVQCRKSATVSVANEISEKSVKFGINREGFDTLTIPGANKLLESVTTNNEERNSAYYVKYGENIGIELDAEHQVYDLNTADQAYSLVPDPGPDYDVSTLNADYSDAISYAQMPYNYIFTELYKDKFDTVLKDPVKSQYYFPYLGKIPQILERISAIITNANNKEASCSLNNNCKSAVSEEQNATSEEKTNTNWLASFFTNFFNSLFSWDKDISSQVIDPQLKMCSELTDDEKGVKDCYTQKLTDRDDDPLKKYLCSYDLEEGCSCEEEETPDDGGTEDCSVLGSIAGQVAWPIHNSSYYNSSTSVHPGVDFAMSSGTRVYAVQTGQVVFARDGLDYNCNFTNQNCDVYNQSPYTTITSDGYFWGGYGNMVAIKYSDGIVIYGHLQKGSIQVKQGQCVKMNDYIANSDNSGNSTGPHLHFEMRKNNPASCLAAYSNLGCVYNPAGDISNLSKALTKDSGDSNGDNDDSGNTADSTEQSCVKNYTAGFLADGIKEVSATIGKNKNNKYENEDGTTNSGGSSTDDLACLVARGTNAINQALGGYYVSPEVVYAVLYGESGFRCSNSGGTCPNDANAISTIVPWTCIYGGACDDGIGISQSLSGVANKVFSNYTNEMHACLDALGVNYQSTSGDAVDSLMTNKEFSRKRVGDSICLVALITANKGRSVGFSESDRSDVNKSMVLAEYYTCPADTWCDRATQNYLPPLTEALSTGMMNKCSN